MPKIAICDDEQPIREYLKSLTEKCIPDSQVRLFGSGEALLRDQTSFDVILLDVSLRGEEGNQTLNGMETARKIRETSNAMIIFVTAFKEYVFEGYDVGAFHYLLKPVDKSRWQLYGSSGKKYFVCGERGAQDCAAHEKYAGEQLYFL